MRIALDTPRTTCGWKVGLTKSFRNASSKLWSEYGTNLQNQPDDLRRIYLADSSKLLVQADQAGAEALIVAYEAPKGNYRSLFEYNVKVHSWLAMQLFYHYWITNTPYDVPHLCSLNISDLAQNPQWKDLAGVIKSSDGWEPKKRFYFIAKMVVHASSYGMRGPTFQVNVLKKSRGAIVLTRKQADEFLEKFHSLFPEIHLWHDRVRQTIIATRTLTNLFGYPRYFAGHFDDTLWKDAYSWVPQSTVGCISNIQFCNEQDYIEVHNKDWDLLNNCHDSTLTQAPIDEVMEAATVKKQGMEVDLVSTTGVAFKMKSEVSVGSNWAKFNDDCSNCYKAKKECQCSNYEAVNPEGMKEIKI